MNVQTGGIVISHRHLESWFALRLAGDWRAEGVQIFMDQLDAGITAGDGWRRTLETPSTRVER